MAAHAGLVAPSALLLTPSHVYVAGRRRVRRVRRSDRRIETVVEMDLAPVQATMGTLGKARPVLALDAAGDLIIGFDDALHRVDLDSGLVTQFAGGAREVGDVWHEAASLGGVAGPEGLVALPDGSLIIAESRSHRVRRIEADLSVSMMVGAGRDAEPGDGDSARAVQLEAIGRLASTADGTIYFGELATAEDEVSTIFGADRSSFPEAQTACLSGVALRDPASGTVAVVDQCQGLLLELRRVP